MSISVGRLNCTKIEQVKEIVLNASALMKIVIFLKKLHIWRVRVWISGRNGKICTKNLEISSKRITKAGDSNPEKFLVFRKFLSLWNEISVSEKFVDFYEMLDNFLVSIVISYCQSKVIVFQFYQEMNAVRLQNFVT